MHTIQFMIAPDGYTGPELDRLFLSMDEAQIIKLLGDMTKFLESNMHNDDKGDHKAYVISLEGAFTKPDPAAMQAHPDIQESN